jgi:hypothetical protein
LCEERKGAYHRGLEIAMHRATNVQFERAVAEYVRWRAVAEDDRSPAPAWWWGPAFEVRELEQPMPAEWCVALQLPDGSSFADGAGVFLKASPTRPGCHGPMIFRAKQNLQIRYDAAR